MGARLAKGWKESRNGNLIGESVLGGLAITIKTEGESKSLRIAPIGATRKDFMHFENQKACGAFIVSP
jgi:hypothetical protein